MSVAPTADGDNNFNNVNTDTTSETANVTTTDTTGRMERFTHAFHLGAREDSDDDEPNSEEEQLTILLDGYQPTDYYATNLKLTGQANWFGSLNMCHLMAAEYEQMFVNTHQNNICSVLELGSGIGRAGIMAAKLLQLLVERNGDKQKHTAHEGVASTTGVTATNIVLTDGEPMLVPILEHNCTLNELVRVDCELLRWGRNAELEAHMEKGTVFDVILGADLIYGDREDVPKNVRNLFTTVCALLVNKTETSGDAVGKFYLAFTKRNTMSPESLLEIAEEEFGLRGTMHDDFCFDIWDNNVDPESVFWRDCIFVFERVKKKTEIAQKVDADGGEIE
jgi:hypothetical protein